MADWAKALAIYLVVMSHTTISRPIYSQLGFYGRNTAVFLYVRISVPLRQASHIQGICHKTL